MWRINKNFFSDLKSTTNRHFLVSLCFHQTEFEPSPGCLLTGKRGEGRQKNQTKLSFVLFTTHFSCAGFNLHSWQFDFLCFSNITCSTAKHHFTEVEALICSLLFWLDSFFSTFEKVKRFFLFSSLFFYFWKPEGQIIVWNFSSDRKMKITPNLSCEISE